MPTTLTLKPLNAAHPSQDYRKLQSMALQHIQRMAGATWDDYNIHDPGITILELLCYALTDLSYRAGYSIPDLLAAKDGNAANMASQFFTARKILTNRALTLNDYRKLLIDLPGVKNAWLKLHSLSYYANVLTGSLQRTNTGDDGIREVPILGLYDVTIEYMDDVALASKSDVMKRVASTLQANRNLCEDFVHYSEITEQRFVLCAELELRPEADVVLVEATIKYLVEQYLAPDVPNYSLQEMLARTKPDGTHYTTDEIFDGPALNCGFIDDEELAKAELRTEIRLSDLIHIIMDIPGVLAIRDIVVNPDGGVAPSNKWVIPVESGKKALLAKTRLVYYKRNMPVTPDSAKVEATLLRLEDEAAKKVDSARPDSDLDIRIPLGTYRNPSRYYSMQNHFPVVYGLSEYGVPTDSDRARALAYQLKGYLLFFDQLMANSFAQLGHLQDLFSISGGDTQTYFAEAVDSFKNFESIYNWKDLTNTNDATGTILPIRVETEDEREERRNRFLDHLISRYAERFGDYTQISYSTGQASPQEIIKDKSAFLREYPEVSCNRALAYNHRLPAADALWDSNNVSGLEKRIARLLGIDDYTRRNLWDASTPTSEQEGMYLIEAILLRPNTGNTSDPFLPICPDPNCSDCAEADPYSYRIHIILPGYTSRFGNMDFRRYAEDVIRSETPAHILPKICWVSQDDLASFQLAYRDWIELEAIGTPDGALHAKRLQAFITALYSMKNVYPTASIVECAAAEGRPKFILGQTALGTMKQPE